MLQRFLPQSPNTTKMHYQIFRNINAKQEHFDLINDLYKQVMNEDKGLAAGVQKNLERGLFINGQLNPRVESAVLHQQARTREIVKEHSEKEKVAGRQIWPAAQVPSTNKASQEDEEFCASLACAPSNQDILAW